MGLIHALSLIYLWRQAQMGRREHGQDYSKDGNGASSGLTSYRLSTPSGLCVAWPIIHFLTEMKSLSERKQVTVFQRPGSGLSIWLWLLPQGKGEHRVQFLLQNGQHARLTMTPKLLQTSGTFRYHGWPSLTLTNTGRPLRPCGFKMVQTIQKMLVICVESSERFFL